MSVVVARAPSMAEQLVCAWPDPVPWGAELVCGEDEVAVICPDWLIGEQLGPGRHKITPQSPSSYVLAYFVLTKPISAPFDHAIAVFDRATGNVAQVRYAGSVSVMVGDPLLLCGQIIGVPVHDLGGGVLRSASNSVGKALQVMIHKILDTTLAAGALATPTVVTQLVHMTASGNPMAIAVNGIDFLRFERVSLSVDGGAPVHANLEEDTPATPAGEATLRVEIAQEQQFAAGAHVLVYGKDGLWHAATVHACRDGGYEVAIDGMTSPTWVDASRVRAPS